MVIPVAYTPFTKPYTNGYVDGKDGGTPITANVLNTNYDGYLSSMNDFMQPLVNSLLAVPSDANYVHTDNNYTTEEKTKLSALVEVEGNPGGVVSLMDLEQIKIGDETYRIPTGESGSLVFWEQIQQTGTKIAVITIDGEDYDIYAPNGGSSSVSWNQITQSGTKIAEITINGSKTDIYAPTSGGGYIEVSGTLTAGQTSLILQNASIAENSTIDIYTNVFGINPTNAVVSTGRVTLTFEAQQSNLGVKVRVS